MLLTNSIWFTNNFQILYSNTSSFFLINSNGILLTAYFIYSLSCIIIAVIFILSPLREGMHHKDKPSINITPS